jgi:hypothetical protein
MGVMLSELASDAIRQAIKQVEVHLSGEPAAVTIRFRNDNRKSVRVVASESSADEPGGLGLARSTVRAVAAKHGCDLVNTTEDNGDSRGSEVTLRIPRGSKSRGDDSGVS